MEVDEDYKRYRQTRSIIVNAEPKRSFKESNSDGCKVI